MKTYMSTASVGGRQLQITPFQVKRPKIRNHVIVKMASIFEMFYSSGFSVSNFPAFRKLHSFDFEDNLACPNDLLEFEGDAFFLQQNVVSTREFLYKLKGNLKCPDELFIAAFLLIRKFLEVVSFPITESNCQRLIACAIVLLDKQYNDFDLSIQTYAFAMNIPIEDLRRMELHFLLAIGWQVHILEEEYEDFLNQFNNFEI